VSSAIDRAGFAILVVQMKDAMDEVGDDAEAHVEHLEKLFLSLA
jgi:hypothetical protein